MGPIRNSRYKLGMRKEGAVTAFVRGMHQDVMIGLNGLDDLAEELLTNMSEAEKDAFRRWLSEALQTLTPSELRGVLNRTKSPIGFDSKAAYALFRAAADQLGIAPAV
jgi:hypothetical protein